MLICCVLASKALYQQWQIRRMWYEELYIDKMWYYTTVQSRKALINTWYTGLSKRRLLFCGGTAKNICGQGEKEGVHEVL